MAEANPRRWEDVDYNRADLVTHATYPNDSDPNKLEWWANTWNIGDPITEEKMDAIEQGLIILMTRQQAILREIGGDISEDIEINKSRIDTLTSLIDANKMSAIFNEIGGTYSNGAISNSKIDTLINEVWGSSSTSGTSRIDNLATELFGSNTVSGTSRLDNVISKASALATEIFGSDTTSGTSRVDTNTTNIATNAANIAALATELHMTLNGTNTDFKNTRLDNIQTWITGGDTRIYNDTNIATRLTNLESKNTSQDTRLNNIETKNNEQDDLLGVLSQQVGINDGESKIDKIIQEIYGNNAIIDESRIDKLEDEVYNIGENERESRLDTIAATVNQLVNEVNGPDSGFENSRIDGLRADVDNLIAEVNGTESGFEDSRIDKLENRTTAVEDLLGPDDQMGSATTRIHALEDCCNVIHNVVGEIENYDDEDNIISRLRRIQQNIETLFFLVNGDNRIIKMVYKMPFAFGEERLVSHYMDLNVRSYYLNGERVFDPYYNVKVDYLGKNYWDNSYFFNNENISYDESTGAFKGTPNAFKLSFNTFFAQLAAWRGGVKLTFDFLFSDPLKSLRLVFNYGDAQINDPRAYQIETPGWQRISFFSMEDSEGGAKLPIYGINTLFYGLPTASDEITLKDVQVEVSPKSRYTGAYNPSTDTWVIPMPEPIYGGYLDLTGRQIVSTYGYIESYNGEEVGNEWQSSTDTLDIGSHIVYKLSEPKFYNITIEAATAPQGFNTVETERRIIELV